MPSINFRNKKTVLVTGGAGFIGSNLCKKLLDLNNHVICLDNLYSGDITHIQGFQSNSDFEFIKHDVTNPYSFYVDEIYNLACPASPKFYQNDPIFTFKTNILGSLNALELATKYNAKILLSSSSEVYGDSVISPQSEEYWGNVNPNGIRSCYDEGKRGAETLFFDFKRKFATRIKVARIFNCYGPNMRYDDGRVVSNFIMQALRNENITVYGDGLQTRSFCYVDDLIDGLFRLVESDDIITGPINLGNPEELTINDLAKKVISLSKSKSRIVHFPLPDDDPKKRKPDIYKAKKYLNWQPYTMIDDGISKSISFFNKAIKAL